MKYKSMLFLLRLFLFPLLVCLSVQTAMAGGEPPISLSATLRLFWGLLIVLGVLLVVSALVRKKLTFFNGGKGKSIITVVETRHLMPKKSVCLIRVRNQEFLIGLGNDQVSLIASIPSDPSEAVPSPDNHDFAGTLRAAASTGNL
jgi:flagellar protein FliO/FliZ